MQYYESIQALSDQSSNQLNRFLSEVEVFTIAVDQMQEKTTTPLDNYIKYGRGDQSGSV